MNDANPLLSKLAATFNDVLGNVIDFVPRLLAALLILVIGWLLARLIRSLVIRLIGQLDVVWQRMVSSKGLVTLQPRHPPTRFIGEILFWLSMLISVVLATEILGLGMFVSWLSEIVRYLPLLVSGLLIVLAGFIVSSLVRDLVTSAMASSGMSQGDAVGRLIQVIILFTAIVIGTDQAGINVSFLSMISAIILAATLGSVALAFGLGARSYVANLIAAHYLRKDLRSGDRIRFGDIQGAIIEVNNSRMILDTDLGRVSIPASLLEQQSFIVEKDQ
jgi:hypothetical protein